MPAISRLSIIPLLIEGRFDQTRLSTGTAFIAVAAGNRPVLITNRHNVTGRNNDTGVCLSSTGGVPNNLVVWHNARTGLGNWLAVRFGTMIRCGSNIQHSALVRISSRSQSIRSLALWSIPWSWAHPTPTFLWDRRIQSASLGSRLG
jgi:hypothetical protein